MKNQHLRFTGFFLCLFISMLNAQDLFQSAKLTKVWETTEGLQVPESAFYYAKEQTIYVSNICGAPKEKDGIGFISLLNAQGEFIEKEWLSGLNAPKGLQIYKGKLYVADLTEVLEIDLLTAQIIKRYTNTQASFLNDIAIDSKGRVYVTETKNATIYFLGKDSLEVFFQSDAVQQINGIWVNKKHLLCGSNNQLVRIELSTKNIEILAENTGYLDGIVAIGKNKILVSDWKGKLQYLQIGKGIENLLNTTSLGIYAADLGWIPKQKILLVPTFLDHKIVAYQFKN